MSSKKSLMSTFKGGGVRKDKLDMNTVINLLPKSQVFPTKGGKFEV